MLDRAVHRRPVPGSHGSLTLYYARITDIAVGVCVVLLFDLVMPWCGPRIMSTLSRLCQLVQPLAARLKPRPGLGNLQLASGPDS